MAKYRKKPVVIDAEQWFENGDHSEDHCGIFDAGQEPFQGEGKVVRYYRTAESDGQDKCKFCGNIMHNHGWIDTVQGGHIVCPGDWIIKNDRVADGQHGHFYPCKPNIFEQTYEEVED